VTVFLPGNTRHRRWRNRAGSRHDDSGNWFRAQGNEQWEFDADSLMRRREASINAVPILAYDRNFPWPAGPRLGRSRRAPSSNFECAKPCEWPTRTPEVCIINASGFDFR
jgi:hypothetical protein